MSSNDQQRAAIERIITKKQLGSYVPYTPQHIARLEKDGKFPKRLQLGPNRVGWLESEIIRWIEDLKANRHGSNQAPEAPVA